MVCRCVLCTSADDRHSARL